jgi:L-threonylcarbamoyladenylate synthase
MNQKSELCVARILNFSEESIRYCVEALLSGHLVAFPTETVYGLGANALDENALEKIFHAKGRPKSDPLIVHISSLFQAKSLTEMTSFQRQCFDILAKEFWPGPLTLIVKASKIVPKLITAGGDSIAIRIPLGMVAQNLLKEVNIPIAAPSANRFGHVSPTKAQHVFDDLGDYPDLLILDYSETCDIGIESTVVKISENNGISILRPGAVSSLQIKNLLEENGIFTEVNIVKREVKVNDVVKEGATGLDSPGQLLTHYAPTIDAFIIQNNFITNNDVLKFSRELLAESIVIDFNSKNINLEKLALSYFDLSFAGNIQEASCNLFSYLRKAESIEKSKYILLPNLITENNEEMNAIFDRIYRAASGKFVQIN